MPMVQVLPPVLYESFQSQNKQHEEGWGLVLTVPQEVEKAQLPCVMAGFMQI